MKKTTKILFSVIMTITLIMGLAVSASAVEESFTINGAGTVAVNMTGTPVFNAAANNGTISMGSDILFTKNNTNMITLVESETYSGWKFSIAITDFHTSGVDDPTDNAAEVMDIYVSSGDWLSFNVDNSSDGITGDAAHTLVPGTGGDGETVVESSVLFLGSSLPEGTPNCSAAATDTLNIVTVDPGYGAGKYFFDLNYTITIDEWLPEGSLIDSSSAAGDRFDNMTVGSQDRI